MNTNMLQDRIRGSLIGGAIGDALGYPVEFMSLREINDVERWDWFLFHSNKERKK